MKPLIYYDFDKTPDDKITINKERLNEVLEEVYNAGVENADEKTNLTHGLHTEMEIHINSQQM